MSDAQLTQLLAGAVPLGSGIGGSHSSIDVDGETIFVKRVPLSDIELEDRNLYSTRDLFGLPSGCQYGVGSPGFGTWREVAANTMATGLAFEHGLGCFATMYHWRVVDGPAETDWESDDWPALEKLVSFWHDSDAVRRRFEAIAAATRCVALFLEYAPTTLPQWLRQRVDRGEDSANAAIDLVENFVVQDVAAMNGAGLFHFDAHFGNVLVNGEQILLADFGLATSPSFDLSEAERTFLRRNASHDVAHSATRLVDWLVAEFVAPPNVAARDAFIETVASSGRVPVPMAASARRVVERYAPLAVEINRFYAQLHTVDRRTEYPTDEVLHALDSAGLGLL